MNILRNEVFIFVIALVLPLIFFRWLYIINPKYLKDPFIRKFTGVPFHHWHYGVIYIYLSAIFLLFFGEHRLTAILLLGLGLGMIFDEFVFTLFVDDDTRETELKLYGKSFRSSLSVLTVAAAIIILLWLLT